MLTDLHSDIPLSIVREWMVAHTFEELNTTPSRHVRNIGIGYNPVQEMSFRNGAKFYQKDTPFCVAILEKINADLAISLGLPVAPCVIATENPTPTLVSLGLFSDTMSVIQGQYKRLNLHNGDEGQLYSFAADRKKVLNLMKNQVNDDLHDSLKPYRSLLSEMLPFLLWARIHDPNLSNIIDKATELNGNQKGKSERNTGYFIDLEGDEHLVNSAAYTESDWDPQTICQEDLTLVLKDWLAEDLPIEEIFDATKTWETTRLIQKIPDHLINHEINSMAEFVDGYPHLDKKEKMEIFEGLRVVNSMLIKRREQLATFLAPYIPEPTPANFSQLHRATHLPK